jgi:hypothetical protein
MNPLVFAVVFAALGRVSLPVGHVDTAPQHSTAERQSLALPMPRAALPAAPLPPPEVFARIAPRAPRPRAWGELGSQLKSALRGVALAEDEPAPRLSASLRRGLMEPPGAPSQAGVHGLTLTVSGEF